MMRRDGETLYVEGPLTLASVGATLPEGKAAVGEGVSTVDLSGVAEVDSSALALLLAWLREAKRQGRELSFAHLPQGLAAIAKLYGVAELLRAAPAETAHH
ncbi:MAG TPA: STAS domain-containing protein [Burkholderiales bacterium]|nr:STAS domain-containing protein [Burkholderiales bacterium]